jgi:carbohydrate-selective porin OprB
VSKCRLDLGRLISQRGFLNGNPFIDSQHNQGMGKRRSEIILELTYLAKFGSHLAVQPDLQFVIIQTTDPKIKNAVAFMLRFELSL